MRRYIRRRSEEKSALTELNITPLLDLAFVLLIIFMITTPLMEKAQEINVPTSSTDGKSIDPKDVLTIQIDKSGRLFLGQERIEESELTRRLAAKRAASADIGVVVRGDKTVKLQELVSVIDAVQAAGITKFGIMTTDK